MHRFIKTSVLWLSIFCSQPVIAQSQPRTRKPILHPKPVRALWVIRDQIKSRQSIAEVIAVMRRENFNTAIVQVRGRGDAYYKSKIVPRAHGIEEGLDPLAEFIREARPHGIAVQAWVNVFLALDDKTRATADARHISKTRPDWFLRDGQGRSMLNYSRKERRRAGVEGAYLDPAHPEVQKYNISITREIIDNYDLSGIHLDYIRYPTVKAGKHDFGRRSAAALAGIPEKQLSSESLARIRQKLVTDMVAGLRAAIKESHPGPYLTAAVWPNQEKMQRQIFQDWTYWLRANLIDQAYLMAYYHSTDIHDQRMNELHDPYINGRMIIGIGLSLKPDASVVRHQIQSAHWMGAGGICFFDARWFMNEYNRLAFQDAKPGAGSPALPDSELE